LNILRIRIASDDAWRAVELDHAQAAIQRGAKQGAAIAVADNSFLYTIPSQSVVSFVEQ